MAEHSAREDYFRTERTESEEHPLTLREERTMRKAKQLKLESVDKLELLVDELPSMDRLCRLTIANIPSLARTVLIKIATSQLRLQEFRAENCNISDYDVADLPQVQLFPQTLKVLSLKNNKLSDHSIGFLSQQTHLKSLQLDQNDGFTQRGFKELLSFLQSNTQISLPFLDSKAFFYRCETASPLYSSALLVENVASSMPNLAYLSLEGCYIDSVAVTILAKSIIGLTSLELNSNIVEAEGLVALVRYQPKLKRLSIRNNRLGQQETELLVRRARHLRKVELNRNYLNKPFVVRMVNLTANYDEVCLDAFRQLGVKYFHSRTSQVVTFQAVKRAKI